MDNFVGGLMPELRRDILHVLAPGERDLLLRLVVCLEEEEHLVESSVDL